MGDNMKHKRLMIFIVIIAMILSGCKKADYNTKTLDGNGMKDNNLKVENEPTIEVEEGNRHSDTNTFKNQKEMIFYQFKNDGTEDAFRKCIASFAMNEICDFYYRDYDGDEEYECFVSTSKEPADKDNGQAVTIWYINKDGYEKLGEFGISETRLLVLGSNIFFVADLYFTTGSASCLWEVVEDRPSYLENISNKAYIWQEGKQLFANESRYDSFFNKESELTMGHSWKDYWLYYDETGFHEYGATEISEEEFNQYSGSKKITKLIQEKVGEEKVTNWTCQFLRRQNGIININVRLEDEISIRYVNITVRVKNNKVRIAEDIENGCWNDGTYKAAWNEEIAIY